MSDSGVVNKLLGRNFFIVDRLGSLNAKIFGERAFLLRVLFGGVILGRDCSVGFYEIVFIFEHSV